MFNMAAGLTAADDTLPPRMLNEPVPSGSAKGKVSELSKMLPEYYSLRGWTEAGSADQRDPVTPWSLTRSTPKGGNRRMCVSGIPVARPESPFLLEGTTMNHVIVGAGPAGVIASETLAPHGARWPYHGVVGRTRNRPTPGWQFPISWPRTSTRKGRACATRTATTTVSASP